MKILVLAGTYPHAGHAFSGIFNEKCVGALKGLCDRLEVLAPRPYVPFFLPLVFRWDEYAVVRRWKVYSAVNGYEVRDGVPVWRPATPVFPWGVGEALWKDLVAFLGCRPTARRMHLRARFDAILSFNLEESGGIAWRLGRDLRIPASGWAFGEDVRYARSSALGGVVRRAIERLDLVFYQSEELLERGAELLGAKVGQMSSRKHIVLPHGISEPPSSLKMKTRCEIRSALGIHKDQLLVLSVGRIIRAKGIFELLEAISLSSSRDPRIMCVIVGSKPGFDETHAVQKKLNKDPVLKKSVSFLPACKPERVWDFFAAADIFAFPSHKEGMPNSLLEAMAVRVPGVAFAIPPVLEIEDGKGAVIAVPPFDSKLFSAAILRLASSPDDRVRMGEIGRAQVMARFMVQKNMAIALERLSELTNAAPFRAVTRVPS